MQNFRAASHGKTATRSAAVNTYIRYHRRDIIAPMDSRQIREQHEAKGASKARQKLSAYLRERGVPIAESYYPPEDRDFWNAIKEFAELYGATLPPLDPQVAIRDQLVEALEKLVRSGEPDTERS